MEEESLTTNPFLAGLHINTSKRSIKIANAPNVKLFDTLNQVIDSNTDIVYAKEIVRDKAPFIKLYDSTMLLGLSKAELKLFIYIIENIKYGSDFIVLKITDVNTFLDNRDFDVFTKATYYRTISNLNEKDIIAERTKGLYWINPTIFFKGERRHLLNK